MKHRLTKWLSALTALCLLAGLVPAALAEEVVSELAEALPEEEIEFELGDPQEVTVPLEPEEEALIEAFVDDIIAKAGDVTIDATCFPDEVFRSYVSANCDTNGDGMLSEAETAAVKSIDVHYREPDDPPFPPRVTSLKGIEYFPNLVSLDCAFCRIDTVDLSGNPALEDLNAESAGLSTLDLSQNAALKSINLYGNDLTTLDLSQNLALEYASLEDNRLTSLTVAKNGSLKGLACGGNRFTELDLSGCATLEGIDAYWGTLETLDLSGCTALKGVIVAETGLKTLDLTGCNALEYLEVPANALSALDLPDSPALHFLSCPKQQIKRLDLSAAPKLVDLYQSVTPEMTGDPVTLLYERKNDGTDLMWTDDDRLWIDADCEIVVAAPEPVGPETVTLPETTARQVYEGDQFRVQLGSGQVAKKFKSSSTKVAKVDDTGLVTAQKAGKCKITVTPDSGKGIALALTVLDPYAPDSIAIADPGIPYLGVKDKVKLSVKMTALRAPAKATLKWKSSKSTIASVDKNGVVTGKKAGTTTITVTTNNKLTASFDLEVVDIHAPTKVTLSPASVEPIAVKGTVQLTALLEAIGEPATKLKWKSSKSTVASVDKNGLVTGKKPGTTTITVTTANKISASVTVTVE